MLTATTPEVRDARPNRTRALCVGGGAVAAAIAWCIEVPLGGTHLTVQLGGARPQTVVLGEVIGAALVAGLLGWLMLVVLQWLEPYTRAAWIGVTLLILAASLVLPLTAATTTSAAVSLIVLHLVVGAVLIPGMARTAQHRS